MSGPPPDADVDAWLGIEVGPDGAVSCPLTAALARFDGRLFGGAGLAIAVAAQEAATGRRSLWCTVQFVGTAEIGQRIDTRVEVLAQGRNATQVQVTATVGGEVLLVALGSTARTRAGAFEARLGSMPDVTAPDDSTPWTFELPVPASSMPKRGPFATAEFRAARGADGEAAMWARVTGAPQTRATLAYLADFVPTAVLRAAGRMGGGTSLDNSIRYGPEPATDTDWVLIDSDPWMADNGYVHGAARLWAPTGELLAVASQTAAAKIFA